MTFPSLLPGQVLIDDQIGHLTFTDDLAAAIEHLLTVRPEPGVYNLSAGGEPTSWAGIARKVFTLTGHDPERDTPVPTAEYYAAQGRAEGDDTIAPRPRSSVLDLSKIESTGFTVREMVAFRRSDFAALATHIPYLKRPGKR